jgi:hypothetical protein
MRKINIYKLLALTLLMGSVILPAPAQKIGADVKLGENQIADPGFENADPKWLIPAKFATIVEGHAYEGKKSIHFKHMDPKVYAPRITQKISVSPGETIYFSVWVKAKDVDATNAEKNTYGARVYLQSYDAAGKMINGIYPASSGPGTYNWKQIGGVYTVPMDAETVSIGIGFLPGITGEVWFDNVSLQLEAPELIESFIVSPNYRGMVLSGDENAWTTKLRINPSALNLKGKVRAVYTLKDKKKVLSKSDYTFSLNKIDTTLLFSTPKGIAIGNYTWNMQYFNEKGKLVLDQEHPIEVVKSMPEVYIDKEGFTVKNGKRIFPFGVYIGHHDDQHLKRIKEAGFNTVLSYGYGFNKGAEAYLDHAHEYNLNVIYSLKDMYEGRSMKIDQPRKTAVEYINKLKNKPALLSWYTVDELLPEWLPKIKDMYNDIVENDKNHPAFQVHYYDGARMLEKYYYTTDIMATDPYPVGRPDLNLTTIRTNATVNGMHGSKGVWSVPQIMDWAVYQKDRKPKPPTLDEMRNQAYQAIISGAKGMVFYSYYDLFHEKWPRNESFSVEYFNERWKGVSSMSKEISALIPMLLAGKEKPLTILANDGAVISAKEYNGELFILLANPYYKLKSLSINIPAGWQIVSKDQGQITAIQTGSQLKFTLPSIGSGLYKLTKKL